MGGLNIYKMWGVGGKRKYEMRRVGVGHIGRIFNAPNDIFNRKQNASSQGNPLQNLFIDIVAS